MAEAESTDAPVPCRAASVGISVLITIFCVPRIVYVNPHFTWCASWRLR